MRAEKEKQRDKKKEVNPEAYNEEMRAEKEKQRDKEREEDPTKYKLKEKIRKQTYRLRNMDTAFKRKKLFLSAVRNGRIFFCICCHRKLYDNQVIELDENWSADYEKLNPGSISKFIGYIPKRHVFIP